MLVGLTLTGQSGGMSMPGWYDIVSGLLTPYMSAVVSNDYPSLHSLAK